MLSIIGFLIILAPLVIVHEFGHYIFARIFGVKAEIFSIGFGPRLFARQLGETELRVSAIPLGGYVKLLGEERDVELSAEDKKRSLHSQAAWKRFFIFFGGPLFNFMFAILVFMVILVLGEPHIASVAVGPSQEATTDLATVTESMKLLSHEHREMLVMICVKGMKYEEVSEILQIPVGTVRSRLSRARSQLQDLLESAPAKEKFSPTPIGRKLPEDQEKAAA